MSKDRLLGALFLVPFSRSRVSKHNPSRATIEYPLFH